MINKNKILRWVSRVAIWTPFLYYAYLYYNDQAGPQPADFLNKKFGSVGVILVVINLYIGVLVAIWKPFPSWLRFLLRERRFLGISSGLYLIMHFILYLLREGLEAEAISAIAEKFYLAMGFSALLVITVLTLTSSDFAVKKMGYKTWKNVHRFVYLGFGLMMLHILFIEKANIPKYVLILGPAALAQAFRFGRWSMVKLFSAKNRKDPFQTPHS